MICKVRLPITLRAKQAAHFSSRRLINSTLCSRLVSEQFANCCGSTEYQKLSCTPQKPLSLRADITGTGPCLQPQYQGFKNIIPYSYLLWVRFIVVYFLGPCSAPLLRTEILAIMAIFSLSKMNQLL